MTRRFGLFAKYATYTISLVTVLLLVSGYFHLHLSSTSARALAVSLQGEKAESAAALITQHVLDIDRQIGWAELAPSGNSAELREDLRLQFLRQMRQTPSVTTLSWVGADGLEQLRVSRIELDRVGSGIDMSAVRAFQEAASGKTHFGAPHFYQDSEPYITVARPLRGGGVVMAEVNLKFIWDGVAKISQGSSLQAYVVDGEGTVIAHPDIALVLKKTSALELPQVRAAHEGRQEAVGRNLRGDTVFAAHAPVPGAKWTVFVESPMDETQKIIDAAIRRTALLLAAGLAISVIGSFLLARALLRPLRALRDGAARIGDGELGHRIRVNSGDELEDLAGQFNRMGESLQTSYASLEQKVAERTAELRQEQSRTSELLHNILPAPVARELSGTGKVRPVRHEAATILFTDFSGFTEASGAMPPDRMVAELNEIFAAFDEITDRHGVEKIKTIGDAYMAAAGVPEPCHDHAQRCVRASMDMQRYIAQRNQTAAFKWALRIGLHTGPVVSGIVGMRKYAFDVWGDTVNIASRIESAGEVGKVNLSAYTCDLVRGEFRCEYRGKIEAKGKGSIDMYFVVDDSVSAVPATVPRSLPT